MLRDPMGVVMREYSSVRPLLDRVLDFQMGDITFDELLSYFEEWCQDAFVSCGFYPRVGGQDEEE